MLNDAVKDNRLPRNPIAGVDLPRLPTTERRYLTHGQVADLADAAGPYRLLVLVAEAIAKVDGRLIVGGPKSYQRRSMPVPRFLRDELALHVAGKSPDDLVLTSARGETLRVDRFRRTYFDPAATAVGLAGLIPHELRHTAASLAITAGPSIKGVQEMLGHASATLTLDRYGHLFGDELDAEPSGWRCTVQTSCGPDGLHTLPSGSHRFRIGP